MAEKVSLICAQCQTPFIKARCWLDGAVRRGQNKFFCCLSCANRYQQLHKASRDRKIDSQFVDKLTITYDKYLDKLIRTADTIVSNVELARDIVADSMLGLLTHPPIDKGGGQNITGLLFTAVRNNALKAVVKDRCIALADVHDEAEENNATVSNEVMRLLYQEIEQLPGHQRTTIELSLLGKSVKEIAQWLGLTYEHTRVLKDRAIKSLKSTVLKKAVQL